MTIPQTIQSRQKISAIGSYPAAEYVIKDNKIIFDLKKYSNAMSTYTVEEFEKNFRQNIEKSPNKPKNMEQMIKQSVDALKKSRFFEELNAIYSEYLKQPPLEGVLSADKTSITFKKLVLPGYDGIVTYENVTFKKK